MPTQILFGRMLKYYEKTCTRFRGRYCRYSSLPGFGRDEYSGIFGWKQSQHWWKDGAAWQDISYQWLFGLYFSSKSYFLL
jgi:hypothetical protein